MHKFISIIMLTAMILASCSEAKSDRGIKYMPDMYQSPALKSQEAYTITAKDEDGNDVTVEVPAMRVPPTGTVPRHFIPYDAAADTSMGKTLQNPLAADAATLRLGRDKYNQFCAVCHGKDGNAENGYVASKFSGILSVNTELVNTYPDGHLFWIITHGRNRMPDYSAQLTAEERWAVIHYVRALYKATTDKDAKELQRGGKAFEPLVEPVPEHEQTTWPEVTK